jgi:hypothetical protein
MIDISDFIRSEMPIAFKRSYIETGNVGYSDQEFFDLITGSKKELPAWRVAPSSLQFQVGKDLRMQGDIMLETFLELNEPALESKFAIEAEFQKKNVLDGIPPKENFVQYGKDNGHDGWNCVLHAMAMLGATKDEEKGENVWCAAKLLAWRIFHTRDN